MQFSSSNKWQEPIKKWGWLTMARMEMDYNTDTCEYVCFSSITDAKEAIWNFSGVLLQYGITLQNRFLCVVQIHKSFIPKKLKEKLLN